jgi:magnesium chelatase subunit I
MSTRDANPPPEIRTLRELRRAGYRYETTRDELRRNALARIERGEPFFPGIVGYEDTVVPQIQNAILSRHCFILLGLRGQAKTRLLRALSDLLDPFTPVIAGCPLNSHPLRPLSKYGKRLADERGDDLEVAWLPRGERYREKLATPDVTVADLVGDIDPIKAAARRLELSDEDAIQFGIIPRTNRGIFAINELPDLPTRIQVALFNILEEEDVQIRGFPVRLPLDLLLVFTANPEDYTNRGNIITPLRDRIPSQIHTHYPLTLEHGIEITANESYVEREGPVTRIPRWVREVVEETAIQARTSSFVDQNSGVSARMTIALLENVVSNAERRAVRHGAEHAIPRVCDLFAAVAAITGKIELVYEGEREGPLAVARALLGKAIKVVFDRALPDPYDDGKGEIYAPMQAWFRAGNRVACSDQTPADEYAKELSRVPELETLARNFLMGEEGEARGAAMEFVLEGLHQSSILSKDATLKQVRYGDAFDEMVRNL